MTADAVNHPPHYGQVPGVECIQVVEHFSFLRGNAIKYLWRAGAKGDLRQDLLKARWYIDRELAALPDTTAEPDHQCPDVHDGLRCVRVTGHDRPHIGHRTWGNR